MVINPAQFTKFNIPSEKVLARLGYKRGKTSLDKPTAENITELIKLGEGIIEPKWASASDDISFSSDAVTLLGSDFSIKSLDIIKLLEGCTKICGFAVTIGPKLEIKRDLFASNKEPAKALILDAVGSVAVEELAEIANKKLLEENKHSNFTRRFSPGYGDWPIGNQREFLYWLGAENAGIKLVGSSQMSPEKSVSAIFGIK